MYDQSEFNDGVSIKLAEQGMGVSYDLTFVPSGNHALVPLRATLYRFMHDPPRYEYMTKVRSTTE